MMLIIGKPYSLCLVSHMTAPLLCVKDTLYLPWPEHNFPRTSILVSVHNMGQSHTQAKNLAIRLTFLSPSIHLTSISDKAYSYIALSQSKLPSCYTWVTAVAAFWAPFSNFVSIISSPPILHMIFLKCRSNCVTCWSKPSSAFVSLCLGYNVNFYSAYPSSCPATPHILSSEPQWSPSSSMGHTLPHLCVFVPAELITGCSS